MSRSTERTAQGFRGSFGVNSDNYKRYGRGSTGPRTSVGEWSDQEPGYAQSVDKRWRETEGNGSGFVGQSEGDASRKVKDMTRRSAVRAASRYQWSQGRSDGRSFGRRQAAMADKAVNESNSSNIAEQIAQF
jgi:hypothetical protein